MAIAVMIVASFGLLLIIAAVSVCLCRCIKKRRNQKIAIVDEAYEPAIKTERATTRNDDDAFPANTPIEVL